LGRESGSLLALSGGVGGAKLALGLSRVLPTDQLTIVVNNGDDQEFHGLPVSPDLDTVMYTLAGCVNPETGWGVREDTFHLLEMLGRYGAEAWFRLGDKDLATHIRRKQLLDSGYTLSEVTTELCQHLGVNHHVVPMSDGPVRTIVTTDEGELPFQTYFVHRRCEPVVHSLRFDGAERAVPSKGFETALEEAAVLVFCPSNPWLSVDPILAVSGVRKAVQSFTGERLAVSPIVGGKALRGPAAKIMSELGYEVNCLGIARYYQGLCDTLLIDEADAAHAPAVEAIGIKAHVTRTVMNSLEDKEALAHEICRLSGLVV
jgi:LPPG:FO 2-phospho-L-lactate transferase